MGPAQERPKLAEARNSIVSAAWPGLEATEGKREAASAAAALVTAAQPGVSDTPQPSPRLGFYGLLSLLCAHSLFFPTFPSFLGHDCVI